MILLDITIPGDPVPKGRPRSGGGHHYTPKRTREAEELLRGVFAQAYPGEPYDGPVGIHLVFYCATRRHTDYDNLEKLVVDSLQRGRRSDGGVIVDDSQIEAWGGRLYRRIDGEEPRTQILLATLEPDESKSQGRNRGGCGPDLHSSISRCGRSPT